MDPSRADSRYNLNYSMGSVGLSLADPADMYGGNPTAVAALGGRPPSSGLIQTMGSSSGVGFSSRSGNLMPNTTQCQTLTNSSTNSAGSSGQQRGIKRSGSDCYDDHHRSNSGGMAPQSLQGLDSCVGGNGQQQPPQVGSNVPDAVDDSYNALQSKKSPPANGKKTKGRVKIKMEYIDNKLRRYTTFSKRKTGIMKKAYELSTLTGTQVMLLVASETGHVYTFATRKLQPMITSPEGKQLIQACLNSPDPPSVGGGDQRMSATGFEETELSYNIADEDSKDERSPISSANESVESSDVDSPGPPMCLPPDGKLKAETLTIMKSSDENAANHIIPGSSMESKIMPYQIVNVSQQKAEKKTTSSVSNHQVYPASAISGIPQDVLLQLIQSGRLPLHTEEDGSGHQYVAIPLPTTTVSLVKANKDLNTKPIELKDVQDRGYQENRITASKQESIAKNSGISGMVIKQELE